VGNYQLLGVCVVWGGLVLDLHLGGGTGGGRRGGSELGGMYNKLIAGLRRTNPEFNVQPA